MKHPWILAAALLLAACSPQVYPLYLEVRQPSQSGLTLSRKNLSIVYRDGADTLFDRQVASAIARNLEADYFDGREQVGIFHVPADTVTLDLMHTLVMETEGDVVFVLSSRLGEATPDNNLVYPGATSVDSAFVCPVVVPVKTSLDVYDAMGEDKVHHYSGSAIMRPLVYNNGTLTEDALKRLALKNLEKEAEVIGKRISTRFLSTWITESFSFYYFDDIRSEIWVDALLLAMDGKFAAAIDAWTPLLKQGGAESRACACYNIAQAFYLLDDYELSARWLDLAEKTENLSLSSGLRKRLNARLEKMQK